MIAPELSNSNQTRTHVRLCRERSTGVGKVVPFCSLLMPTNSPLRKKGPLESDCGGGGQPTPNAGPIAAIVTPEMRY